MSAVSFFSPGRVRECVYTFSKDLVSLSLGRIKLLGWLIWDARIDHTMQGQEK
jgi:hypothetical protein